MAAPQPTGWFVGPGDPGSGGIAPRGRRRFDREEHARISVTLTSLIDVTFLLLVYFILATQFESGEEIYPVDLPRRLQGYGEVDPFRLDDEPLRIEVSSFGAGGLQYGLRVDGLPDQPATFEQLNRMLAERQINDEQTGGWYLPDHPIIVEPGRTASWDHVVAAFNAAARARYTNILFAEPK